ncbi:FAD-dependent monooxygenase [Amycolatopsis jiangsuensis]|uniref:2-polyprenyl-6-methoxyphenol hydroxylase-like FAD-dependent oxidoreductase n=1 Tax=Amycolatopsis jiangsuensis TaxID=1181879 RepID=A0A840J5I5_9PSEU|nr:FAD-dependent monooxygenase [Amycolatopsis jiangsuensis]MBB4688979.1 2-polyprenyl-6-methoxyphenol hydroxylase-like FAD-dependent oxidoreductase [Amycolatopsis jiangsuensis]
MPEIVIAGGGPNGLLLAAELCLAGVRPVVLERLPGDKEEQRANGLVGQVVQLLHRRGLYARLSGTDEPAPAPAYLFGGFRLDLADLPEHPVHLLPKPQRELERTLAEHAASLGADIRRGHEVTGFSTHPDSVTVRVNGPGGRYELTAGYLVGADGGRSLVRKLAGIGFPGVTRDDTVSFAAQVRIPAELTDPATGGLRAGSHVIPPFLHYRTETGVFTYAPFTVAAPMVNSTERGVPVPPDDGPPTLDEVRASIRRVLGTDLPIEAPPAGSGPPPRRLAGGNTRIATRFRAGRILLLGDAAHVHSAIGGPGLNLGLQDAANLAWKLAAEVHGWAPPGLLDSYDAERRPVSRRVVMHTQAQGALTAPGPEVTELRALFQELLSHDVVRGHLADLLSGNDIRYSDEPHPLVGRWSPDLRLADPEPLAAAHRAARPVLLDLSPGAKAAAAAGPWQDRVTIVSTSAAGETPTALLIRPDGYVAWASDDAGPDLDALRSALARWFGAGVTTAAA